MNSIEVKKDLKNFTNFFNKINNPSYTAPQLQGLQSAGGGLGSFAPGVDPMGSRKENPTGPLQQLAQGGRVGLYQGGQAKIEPDLSGIGHGSNALMSRNMQLSPGSQATTSTGLNYLLGEDNDTTRVPYNEGNTVLPKPKPMNEYLLEQVMSQAGVNTLDPRTRQMFIEELKKKIRDENSKADGGRTGFAMGKRAFLKLLGGAGAGIAGIKTGLMGLGKKTAVKSVAPVVAKAAEEESPLFL